MKKLGLIVSIFCLLLGFRASAVEPAAESAATVTQAAPLRTFQDVLSPQESWMAWEYAAEGGQTAHLLMHTQDSGMTWHKVTLPEELSAVEWNDLCWIGAGRGYLCPRRTDKTAALLYQTQDGGKTWQAVTLPLSDEQLAYGQAISVERMGDILALTIAARYDDRTPVQYEMRTLVCSVSGSTWRLCDDATAQALLDRSDVVLTSPAGYRLTLPYFWDGHVYNASDEALFSLYEAYHYSLVRTEDGAHDGFVLAIHAIPLAGATEAQRSAEWVIGEDDTYYFKVVETGDMTCGDAGWAYYSLVAREFSWIFKNFAQENHLKINPNCYLYRQG